MPLRARGLCTRFAVFFTESQLIMLEEIADHYGHFKSATVRMLLDSVIHEEYAEIQRRKKLKEDTPADIETATPLGAILERQKHD